MSLFNGTVYVEFRVCFTMTMYENDMFLLCETSNAFIGAFCYSKIHFHPSGPFKSIKTMLKPLHVLLAGRYSAVGSDVAWESRGTAIDPRVRHIFL